MLSRGLLEKYSRVLSLLSRARALPYKWNHTHQQMEMENRAVHLLPWLCVFVVSWIHTGILVSRLLLNFSSVSIVYRAIHLLWISGNHLHSTLQAALFLQDQEILQFTNKLISHSKTFSDKLLRRSSSRKQVKKEERRLQGILVGFTIAAIGTPPMILGVFLNNPHQKQFLFSVLPNQLKSSWSLLAFFGAAEVTLIMYIWASVTFFIFLEVSYVFGCQLELRYYRTHLQQMFGTKRWILEYRKLQLRQGEFNACFGRLLLPYQAINTFCLSLIGTYGSIEFFHLTRTSRPLLYTVFPFIVTFALSYELVIYPWMGSIHSLSSAATSSMRKLRRNPYGFRRDVCSSYIKSLAPLEVKMGSFNRSISKSTILRILSFTVVSTARLTILFPVDDHHFQ